MSGRSIRDLSTASRASRAPAEVQLSFDVSTPAIPTPAVPTPAPTPDVPNCLYIFKPPFPSAGGCAAASAGRSGPSAPRQRLTVPTFSIAPECILKSPGALAVGKSV